MNTSEVAVQSNIWENNSILREKRFNPAKQNYMPFLFRSKRQFPYNKDQMPSVGAYQIQNSLTKKNLLENSPLILKQQFIKQNQMGIFKSKKQRFNADSNSIPGPATYNCLNKFQNNKLSRAYNTHKTNANKNHQNTYRNNFMSTMKKSPSCPAIPDSKVRYGYLKDSQGNYKLISKTEQQLVKERQKLKEYCSTLVGQNFYPSNLSSSSMQKQDKSSQKQQLISNLQKFIQKDTNSNVLVETQNIKAIKQIKPKIKLSHPVNYVKPAQEHLGPGCYNNSLDTLKKGKKSQNFQFFGSSQIRFSKKEKENSINPYEHIFKEKKNLSLKTNIPGKIYKKPFSTNFDPDCAQTQLNPGPGSYEPCFENIKKSQSKVVFGYESRFKQNNKIGDGNGVNSTQEEDQNDGRIPSWGNLRKQKIKCPHKQYDPVRQQQIYGIMNQEQGSINFSVKKSIQKDQKNKSSPVFLDKSQRFELCRKSYCQQSEQTNTISNCLGDTKGSFISKLPKRQERKQNTPGPGSYSATNVLKKSFNIKSKQRKEF